MQDHEQLISAALGGSAAAQFELGRMYEEGINLPQSYQEAIRWYRLAAETDKGWSTDAPFRLGHLYEQGFGVPTNFSEAARWYLLSMQSPDGPPEDAERFVSLLQRGLVPPTIEAEYYIWKARFESPSQGSGASGITTEVLGDEGLAQ